MDGVVCVVLCMPTISFWSFPRFTFSSCVVWIYELVPKFVVPSSRFSVPSPFFGVGPFILRYWVLEFDIYVHVLHVYVKVRLLRTV